MSVRQNSRAAFGTVKVNARQAEVLDCIRRYGPISDQGIADELGWTINRVTPRRGELADKELIQKLGDVIGPTNRRVSVWSQRVAA